MNEQERKVMEMALELLESAHVATKLVWKRHDAVEAIKEALAQPAQRTEQNFCPRCGKRTADLTVIHTCTPPQENT